MTAPLVCDLQGTGALWDPYFCRNPVPATPAAVYSRNKGICLKAFPDLGSLCHLSQDSC